MGLSGQLALVTGGGTGMGRAIAHALAAEGCRVVAVGRRADKLADMAKDFAGPGQIAVRAADVADHGQVVSLMNWVGDNFGAPAILVNNAGVNIKARALDSLSVEDWNRVIAVNLTGAFHMIHAVLPAMRARRDGLIVNISSIAGIRPSILGGAAYTASKFGLTGLSGVVASEEAAHGIRCTSLCPGEVATPLLDTRPEPVSAERRAAMVQPEDVAAAVLFIARLPPRAHVPELILKPLVQEFA